MREKTEKIIWLKIAQRGGGSVTGHFPLKKEFWASIKLKVISC